MISIVQPHSLNHAVWQSPTHFCATNGRDELTVHCRKWLHRSIHSYISGYQKAGSWTGHFYEAWTRELLLQNPMIRRVEKINRLNHQVLAILEGDTTLVSIGNSLISNPRVTPDFLIEFTNGNIAFVEVKSFAPTNGAVIYEAQLEWQIMYEQFGIPVYYVLIRHSIRDASERFKKGLAERKKMQEDLRTPLFVRVVSRSVMDVLCKESGNAWITDRRKLNEWGISPRFKVLRQRFLERSFVQFKIPSLTEGWVLIGEQ